MTAVADPPVEPAPEPPEPHGSPGGTGVLAFLTTTDHKRIGVAYMVTSFAFFLLGGLMAMVMRAELARPGLGVTDTETYNQLFTMHGLVMLLLFLGPFAFGLANYFVPLHIGAPDMSFPRLNALSYWLYLGGGLTMVSGFLSSEGPPQTGWTLYTPLSENAFNPSVGLDLVLIGIVLTGTATILTAVNIITTVLTMRAPGMTMFRVPVFTWNMTIVSLLVLLAFPNLTAAGLMLLADRQLGARVFDGAIVDGIAGSPLLWQHLFWFFGHPEVYILILPYFGVVTEVIPVFSWRPVFGYRGIIFATVAIAALSVGVWAHHMFTTGTVNLGYFAGLSFLIAVPTGVKIFNWIGTMWGGRLTFQTPMLFAIGFIVTFVIGGVTGVLLASPPLDFQLHDTYFVVAHMHYVLFGGALLGLFAGVYYWFPKITGKLLGEGLGRLHFATTFVGFHLTFFVQFLLGQQGMPRRVANYLPTDGFTWLNEVSTAGAFLTGISTVVFLVNVALSLRSGREAGDDPWGGQTLEWATSSPPPPTNFDRPLPPIRSVRPVFDARHDLHSSDLDTAGRHARAEH